VKIGMLVLGNLVKGQWRELTKYEVLKSREPQAAPRQ
jgi:16S rRNA U516 pseudouridylate synthase RsuA-like enzyme